MARTDTLGNFLTDVADAIRTKGGTSEPIQASSFDTAIENLPTGGTLKYQRPSDWWDTKTILTNAEDITQNGTTYYPAYIMLLNDSDDSTTVSYNSTAGQYTYGDAFLFSDEPTTLYVGTQTHTWDKTKDKACSLGYKTRYIIVYVNSRVTTRSVDLSSFKMLECIFGNFLLASTFKISANNYIENLETLDTCNITTLGATNGFNNCRILQHVYMPTITSITGGSIFSNSINIIELDFPNLTSISSSWAFGVVRSLSTVNMPKLATISGSDVFHSDNALTKISLPSLTTITGSNTFQECFSLSYADFPNLTNASGNYTFRYCHFLREVNMPKVTILSGTRAFEECFNLAKTDYPVLETLTGQYLFYLPYGLKTFHFSNTLTTVGSNIFNSAINLSNVTVDEEWNLPLTLSSCALSRDSMVGIIANLKDLSGETGKTMTFGNSNLAKLTSADIQVATDKNWTLS